MNGVTLLAATAAALAVGLLSRAILRPLPRLAPRLAPYSARARAQLGTTMPQRAVGPTSVWGPLVAALANALAGVVDASSAEATALRLRQAGFAMDVDDYRNRQLAWTVGGLAGGGALAVVLRAGPVMVFVLMAVGAVFSLARWRSQVDRRIDARRTTMRAEAPMMCQLLAVWLQTGDTAIGALERLVGRTVGVTTTELASAASLIRGGSLAPEVLERLARECAEPSTARLYRLYAATWSAGGDPTALLALANDLRAARRQDLERTMARRRTLMVIPLVLVLGPIMILFIVAPIPSLIFGR